MTVLEFRVRLAGSEPKLARGNQVSATVGTMPDAKAYVRREPPFKVAAAKFACPGQRGFGGAAPRRELTLGDAQAALLLLEAAEGGLQGLAHHGLAARRQQGQFAAGSV